MSPEVFCAVCNYKLTYHEKFEGLPCNSYCCGDCPGKNDPGGCPKEKKFGSPFAAWSKPRGVKKP